MFLFAAQQSCCAPIESSRNGALGILRGAWNVLMIVVMTDPGSILVVGDLQGCLDPFERLLDAARAAGWAGPLWIAGDLINRGPDSVGVLRRLIREPDCVAILGNHDLAFLAVAAGVRSPKRGDTLDALLAAPDRDDLIDWLRARPLAHFEAGHLMVHAGVDPRWTVQQTLDAAAEVQAVLRSDGWCDFMRHMWGNAPEQWRDDLQGWDRLRAIVNVLTRLRFCTPAGRLDFDTKDGALSSPPGMLPWFDIPRRATGGVPVVFGHWSTVGLIERPNLIGLDTGCVWGQALTGCILNADWTQRRFVQVPCAAGGR
jgi:bis(5'-nucleosyl)-tetraphosphatase (symmetrical)